jgi:hypothetical protein
MRQVATGRRVYLALTIAALTASVASAQQFPFSLLATQGNNAATLQNGGGIAFTAPIGQTSTAQIKATYTGTGQATISQQPIVIGSTAFTASFDGSTPLILTPGASVTISIQFKPASAASNTAQLSLPFTDAVPATTPGGTPTVSTGAINVGLAGSAPSFVLSYVLTTDQNVVPLPPGGTISFPPTPVNTTAQAALNLTNNGSGPGVVTGLSITGTGFRITGRPLFPLTLAAGQTLQVQVLYQPTAVGSNTGQIQISFDSGSPVTVGIEGTGSSPGFVYQVLTDPPTTVPAGGVVPIPDTNIGQTSSVVIRITNSGTASGTVSAINLTGQGYSLSNGPVLPQTLAPNGTITFTLNFAPTQPGTSKGSLFINSDTLVLAGVGLGPQLGFSYAIGSTTVTLSASNNSVIFSPIVISQSAQATFDVKNTGTQPAVISNIGIGQTNSPYTLSGLPPLPVTVPAGADFKFNITFTPTVLGFSNGTLVLDSATVNLVGSGTQPPALPSYSIGGASGTVQPGAQPSITLTLANPYPVALSGVLTATVSGTLPADPAVLFANGSASVPFTIAANSTSAVFGTQGTQIGLQTGTVAGTITLTPTFSTRAGGVDLTPANPTVLPLTIAPAAPVLAALQISGQTATSLTVSVTGFTTPRTLTSVNIQFTTAPGFSMPVTKFTVDLQQVASLWFQSTASRAFGSQFTLSIPFTLQGTPPANQTLVNGIASVSASVVNGIGTSNTLQANAQ